MESVPTTRITYVSMFVEADCVPEAHVVKGYPDTLTVSISDVSIFGSPDELRRVLTDALAALDAVPAVTG